MPVYFIQSGDDGPIKIGYASAPQRRLMELQVGSPEPLRLLATIDGDESAETEVHKLFNIVRIRGEWFAPTADLSKFISDKAVQHVAPCRRPPYAVMKSFRDVIDCWPTRTALAADVAISDVLARAWWQRNSIPPSRWQDVVRAAQERGYDGVTYDLLVACATDRRKQAEAA